MKRVKLSLYLLIGLLGVFVIFKKYKNTKAKKNYEIYSYKFMINKNIIDEFDNVKYDSILNTQEIIEGIQNRLPDNFNAYIKKSKIEIIYSNFPFKWSAASYTLKKPLELMNEGIFFYSINNKKKIREIESLCSCYKKLNFIVLKKQLLTILNEYPNNLTGKVSITWDGRSFTVQNRNIGKDLIIKIQKIALFWLSQNNCNSQECLFVLCIDMNKSNPPLPG